MDPAERERLKLQIYEINSRILNAKQKNKLFEKNIEQSKELYQKEVDLYYNLAIDRCNLEIEIKNRKGEINKVFDLGRKN